MASSDEKKNLVRRDSKANLTRNPINLYPAGEHTATTYNMPAATVKPNTSFETLKREHLFRNPPKDKSAFPALLEAIRPHIDSFNAVTEEGGLLDLARKDIGVKSVFDGKEGNRGNKISRRCSQTPLRPTADRSARSSDRQGLRWKALNQLA
jgi:acetylornithine/succinyldiaminopimelate/putrescine aminotransferase